jgi:hypothetical protein
LGDAGEIMKLKKILEVQPSLVQMFGMREEDARAIVERYEQAAPKEVT